MISSKKHPETRRAQHDRREIDAERGTQDRGQCLDGDERDEASDESE
jgi:hypothetical protein